MLLQQWLVEHDGWLGVHADRLVYEHKFCWVEPALEQIKQLPRKLDVVNAVPTERIQIIGCEVTSPLAHGADYFIAFLAQPIVRGQFLERSTYGQAMPWPCHRQRIQPEPRTDAELPRQDSAIEHCVVAEDSPLAVVQRTQELTRITACVPVSRMIVDLDADTDHLKARVTDIGFRCHLRQTEVLVVISFEVNRNDVHHMSSS